MTGPTGATGSTGPTGATDASLAGQLVLGGIVTPANLAANQNNYNPAGLATASQLRLTLDITPINMTGIVAQPAGTLLTLTNVTAAFNNLHIIHESGLSSAANRFRLTAQADWYIPTMGSMTFIYDGTLARWVIWSNGTNAFPSINGNGGPGLTVGGPGENTGLTRPATLTLGLMAGAATRVRLDANGADPRPFQTQSDTYLLLQGQMRLSAVEALGPLAGSINNQALATTTINVRITTSAPVTFTGLAGGAAGRVVHLINVGPDTITLNSEDVASTAANRFLLATATLVIAANGICQVWYDTTSSRWRAMSIT